MSIKDIAAKGRYGDTHLLHVSDAEVQGLNALANDIYGHGLTTNPDTGLPEAFLFAPFLAPFIAGAGSSMLGTAAIAGGLGAAEAAARGMDDPLGQGLMAGLTAGAGSALGSSLGNIGSEAATQAATTTATDTAAQMAAQEAAKQQAMQSIGQESLKSVSPELLQSSLGTNTLSSGMPEMGSNVLSEGPFNVFNAPSSIPSPAPTETFLSQAPAGGASVTSAPSVFNPGAASNVTDPGLFARNYPNFGQPGDVMGRMKNIGRGISEVGSSGEAFGNFLSDNQGALASGMIGIGGQAQYDQAQKMREAGESREAQMKAESDAKRKAIQDQIKANYAAVGRPMPTGPYGGPLFKEGGDVKPEYHGDGRYLPDWVRQHAKKTDKRAEGGLMSLAGGTTRPFDQARGYAAGGMTTNIYGDLIPYDNSISSDDGGVASVFGRLFAKLFADAGITPDGASKTQPQYAQGVRHKALVDKLQTGMGNQQAVKELDAEGYASGGPLFGGIGDDDAPNSDGNILANLPGSSDPGPTAAPVEDSGQVDAVAAVQALRTAPVFLDFLGLLQGGAGNQLASQQSGYTGIQNISTMANGGYLETGGRVGDGMSDDIPATIDGSQPAALSDGEFVIPADVVSHLGNGSSDAGAQQLYSMMDRIRQARTGTKEQGKEINPTKMMPA